MPEQKTSDRAETARDKSQDLVPPGREPVHQGQQFDEMQRQQKNPDGAPKDENESQQEI
ncbi:MAG TPA: hypothetical protein VH350_09110 [Candidatus Sulfotelmatobacter sp.]|jgi:hypothetical protein|nr:hypothetical protein [Candidatus Sulfotelmatobacter sp.]